MEPRIDPFTVHAAVKDRDVVRLTLSGDLDLAVAPHLLAQVTGLLPPRDGTCVELDLSAVSFVDISGARALLSLHRVLGLRGHEVVMVAPSPALTELMTLLRCASWAELAAYL